MKSRKLVVGLITLGLVVAAGWYGWRRYTTPTPPNISLEGVAKEKAEKIEQATEAARRNCRSGTAWGELGLTLLANGFPEESVPCFAHAERFDSTEPRWPHHQGITLITTGNREGFAKLRRALATAHTTKTRRIALFTLARALIEDGQFDEAEKYAGELRSLEGDAGWIDYTFGLVAYGRGDHAAARAHLGRLTEHPSARKRAHSLLATLNDGDAQLAQDHRRRAGELPNDRQWPDTFESELEHYRAVPQQPLAPYRALQAEGRHEEAITYLLDLVRRSPTEEYCLTLGFDLIKANRFEEAALAYRQAIELNPRNAKSHMFLGVCLLQLGEQKLRTPDGKDKAMGLFREVVAAEDKAIALQNDLTDAHLTRGRALKHLGRTSEAIEAFRQAVRVGTEFAEMHQVLGETLAEVGQLREGLEHLENAVKLAKPNDTRPQLALDKWKLKAKTP